MWAIEFFIYAMIIFLLALLFGGTMIGYYFAKKKEYEIGKLAAIGKALKPPESGQK